MILAFSLFVVALSLSVGYSISSQAKRINQRESMFPHSDLAYGIRFDGSPELAFQVTDIAFKVVDAMRSIGCENNNRPLPDLLSGLNVRFRRAEPGEDWSKLDCENRTYRGDTIDVALPAHIEIPLDQTRFTHHLLHWLRARVRGTCDANHNLEHKLWIKEKIIEREQLWMTPRLLNEIKASQRPPSPRS